MPHFSSTLIYYTLGKATDQGGGKPYDLPWSAFAAKFREPHRSNESQEAYGKLKLDEQKHQKMLAGWWFRAQNNGKRRTRTSAKPAQVITLDFDAATPAFFKAARTGKLGVDWPYFIHTTRRHTPANPRFRMVILLESGVSNEDYAAVSRIACQKIDPGMIHVDEVSFRSAQMMYMPTASRGQEYVHALIDGEPLDWGAMLDVFADQVGDWRDLSILPTTPNEKKLRATAAKMEDPTEKDNPVGFFCRRYSVHDVMDHFDLPYVLGDESGQKARYTYTGGTTTNGAEVQEDGLFLTSYHGSDPISDMTVNAFDLVRIHKYGDLAENEGEGTPMASRQSWKRMLELCEADEGYVAERTAARFDEDAMLSALPLHVQEEIEEATEHEAMDADMLEVIGPYNGYAQPDLPVIALTADARPIRLDRVKRRGKAPKGWIGTLDMTPQGVLKKTVHNVAKIASHDARLRDSIGLNLFINDIVVLSEIKTGMDWMPTFEVADRLSGDNWQDKHDAVVRTMFSAPSGPGKVGWGLEVPDRDLGAGLRIAAHNNAFHPVRETLESFVHDGVARAESLFIDWLGCPDTPYYRETAKWFLIAAIARIYEPGHKFDYAPVLHGAQGVRKSTFIRILALNWFGELTADFDKEQELAGQMSGCWIMEMAELASMARGKIEDVKVFMSALVTKTRLAYDKRVTVFPRQCVFMGSTNNLDFLKDETGNRRFWPIEVLISSINTEEFAKVVPQIWAEAMVWYRAMRAVQPDGHLPLFLSPESEEVARGLQEQSRRKNDADLLAELFQPMLEGPVKVDREGYPMKPTARTEITVLELLDYANANGFRVQGGQGAAMIGQAMVKLGWTQTARPRVGGVRTSRYRLIDDYADLI